MPAFEVPECYMPYPARMNPHVDRARRHNRAWAREIGILGSSGDSVWDEHRFDSADFAAFAAFTHPDAAGPELDLLVDWYVWLFFLDDHFLATYKQSRDLAGAKEFLAGLPAFMPVHPAQGTPDPAGPVQRGLTDLWPRTVPATSEDWRRRFVECTTNLLAEFLWELSNLDQSVVPNPIDYIEMRRRTSGAPWSAALVEHAAGLPLPAELVHTRPVRVLTDTFSDWVGFSNDIFSYEKEMAQGETHNGVLIVERFLGRDPRQAAGILNDLANSRLYQFENTAVTELPALMEKPGLGVSATAAVLGYVRGLQDWMAGDLHWHKTSSRYAGASPPAAAPGGLTGLGTAAARLRSLPAATGLSRLNSYRHVPHRTVGRLEPPEFPNPFPVRCNPHREPARVHAKAWARRMGMLNPGPDPHGAGVWTEPEFDSTDVPLLVALAHPDVPGPELDLSTDWYVWGYFLDDFFLEAFTRPRNLLGANAFLSRLATFLTAPDEHSPVAANPAERGLAELWTRTLPTLSGDQRPQLVAVLRDYLDSLGWELANVVQNRVPDPVDYIEMRRRTSGTQIALDVVRRALPDPVEPHLHHTRPMRTLTGTACDIIPLWNDVLSYRREIEREGDLNNAVLVLQRFLDCGPQRAAEIVTDLATSRVRQFEHVVAAELPALGAEHARSRDAIGGYADALRHWMGGYLHWAAHTGRYRNPEPVALGTAAARVVPGAALLEAR